MDNYAKQQFERALLILEGLYGYLEAKRDIENERRDSFIVIKGKKERGNERKANICKGWFLEI